MAEGKAQKPDALTKTLREVKAAKSALLSEQNADRSYSVKAELKASHALTHATELQVFELSVVIAKVHRMLTTDGRPAHVVCNDVAEKLAIHIERLTGRSVASFLEVQ